MKTLAFALCLSALPAMADLTYPGGRPIICYCTDSVGGRVEMGAEVCLSVGTRSYMARCDMSQNVPMWRDTGEGCPMS